MSSIGAGLGHSTIRTDKAEGFLKMHFKDALRGQPPVRILPAWWASANARPLYIFHQRNRPVCPSFHQNLLNLSVLSLS